MSSFSIYGKGRTEKINNAVNQAVNGGVRPKRLGNKQAPVARTHVDVGSESGDLHKQWLAKRAKQR